jgi:hypothetical protein
MPPAIIGAAIAGVATIGGAVIAGHSASSAASTAAASQQAASAQQLQLGREQMGQARDVYNANYAMLSPFVGRGDVAGQSINALLGLPSAPAMTSPLATASGGAGQQQLPPTPAPTSSRSRRCATTAFPATMILRCRLIAPRRLRVH